MPDTPSITINKQITYRGQPEVYSNTYHFSGTTPSTDTAWHDLAKAIFASESPILGSATKFVGYLGYAAGNNFAVSIKNYLEDGTAPIAASGSHVGTTIAGDTAAVLRWNTPDRTSRGKRIYLRKYFHEVDHADDLVSNTCKAAMLAHGNKMIDGTLPGGAKICGPQGAVASVPFVMPYVTTRTLKRRGKRPSR